MGRNIVRIVGRVAAMMTLATALLGGGVVAFAAHNANQPDHGQAAHNNNDRGQAGMSVSGVWNVTLTSGKFVGRHGTATLVQQGANINAAVTDGTYATDGHGTNIGGAVTLRGQYKLFAHTAFATTVYSASVAGQLSADGKSMTGTWVDSLGDSGAFTASRS